MGLTTWKNSPDVRILKSDVMIAKNYLDEKQIKRLERTVSGYFDYIEDLVERENTFTMEESIMYKQLHRITRKLKSRGE